MSVPALRVDVTDTPAAQVAADWLVVPAYDTPDRGEPWRALDAALGGLLNRVAAGGDFAGRMLETVPLVGLTGTAAPRVLLVGLGKPEAASRGSFHAAATAATKAVTGREWRQVAWLCPRVADSALVDAAVVGAITGLAQGSSGPAVARTTRDRFAPERFTLVTDSEHHIEPAAVRRGLAEANGVALARHLVDLPPADLTPEAFARHARERATELGFSVEVWDKSRLEAERMNLILAVGRASVAEPRLVVLRWDRGGTGPRLGLVGKGVTFDSGGLSLKTTDQMVDMKCDMAGAAAVLGAFEAAARLELPVNLVGVLPLAENMPGGAALRLGDVVRSRSGPSVEILNTDAEGRLILADALAYAAELGCTHLLDLATLTGACLVALGTETAGLMAGDEPWGDAVRAAFTGAGERVWPLPMDESYDALIKSQAADIRNTGGGRWGGAIAGAKFLQAFVGRTPWVHLDIAGPAWADSAGPARDAGGTGFGVRGLVELLHRYGR